jgi:NADH-quinone oxidoreductase subunit L
MELLSNIFPPQNFTLVAVILGLPALGAFVNGVFGKRLGKDGVRLMALSAIGGSFLASLIAFAMLVSFGRAAHGEHGAHADVEVIDRLKFTAWHWFDVSTTGGFGSAPIEVAFTIDRLTSVMMLVITGVGFLIHLYATAYMWDDQRPDGGFHRFFSYLNLFCFAMLVLVMGSSLPILFVGWEGVGMCSYLLIGFWYSDDANAAAGKKAFIANRIGDFGLLVAMGLLLSYAGALDWEGIGSGSGSLLQRVHVWPMWSEGHAPTTGPTGWFVSHLPFLFPSLDPTVATVVGLCLFLGCAGKSAQIPLYVWLPDAMAGPTPVSALIHAATMVTAGVYLVCRLWFVFLLSPFVMATVATIGVLTAFFAATIGLAQTDIKKVLAYSTVSQLGFMFLGVGVGAFSAGFFHVFTHAFFKACLFLGAGSVIHAMHAGIHDTTASQDMRNMGGLRKWLPITYITFFASCLAIGGFPLTSGFFSKDEILYRAYVTHISAAPAEKGVTRWEAPAWFGPTLYWIGILAATMTAFYMFRALFLTFWGDFRGWEVAKPGAKAKHGEGKTDKHEAAKHEAGHEQAKHDAHGHEHHGPMAAPHESPWPMTVPLFVLAAFALVGGVFNPGLFSAEPGMEHWLLPLFQASEAYVKVTEGAPTAKWLALPGVLAFFVGAGGAYFVYVMSKGEPARVFTEKVPGLYRLVLDKWRVDEFYENTVIGMVESLAETAVVVDKWLIDGIIARLTSLLVAAFGTLLRAFQTGVVHVYAAAMVVGIAVFGWFFVWQPQAGATVHEQSSGKYIVEASPGLGYQFRWHSKTPDQPDSEAFSGRRTVEVDVSPGETKLVKLDVKNAFDRTTTSTVVVTRPSPSPAGSAQPPILKGSIR